jgi:uncharacterized small protein (DUF1192 family)
MRVKLKLHRRWLNLTAHQPVGQVHNQLLLPNRFRNQLAEDLAILAVVNFIRRRKFIAMLQRVVDRLKALLNKCQKITPLLSRKLQRIYLTNEFNQIIRDGCVNAAEPRLSF